MLTRDGACRIAQNMVSVPQLRWRGLPATVQPISKQFRSSRAVIPHGDRRDGAESGDVECQEVAAGKGQQHVVCVFVLRDDLLDLARW